MFERGSAPVYRTAAAGWYESAEQRLAAYPHELVSGMAQRVRVAPALMHCPKLLVADEPTADLCVAIQGPLLNLMQSLARECGTAQRIVTADLGMAARYLRRGHAL